jgi:hypothetical protein
MSGNAAFRFRIEAVGQMKINQNRFGLFTGFAWRHSPAALLFISVALCTAREGSARVLSAGYPANANQANATPSNGGARPSPVELLDRVRASAERVFADLTNFVCGEQIERFRGSAHNPAGHRVDVITSQVSYVSNAEHYSDIFQNNKPLRQIGSLSGAWSEGEYGTILRETITALRSRAIKFIAFSMLEGQPAAVYSFEYTSADSPWDIAISGSHYTVPFRGQVWASPGTGNILRIDRIARNVPVETGIAGVNWAVMFGPRQADGKTFWLPSKGVYSVSYLNSDRHEWNEIAFSDYKRYSSDVVVHFR